MSQISTATAGALDLDAVGNVTPVFEREWTTRDVILYAIGVGAGQEDPTAELAFTTENSHGITQRVLPTFAVALGLGPFPDLGDVSPAQVLHASQGVTLHRDLPVAGRSRSTTTVTGIFDKGKGALVTIETDVRDADDEQPLATLAGAMFIRGAGGWGGDSGPSQQWNSPDRPPDEVRSYATSPGQALVYRLSGDLNPLHSDPAIAKAVGFPRPILHGLCTYGFSCRALLEVVCEGDPSRFGSMNARFSQPVFPGQRLDVSMWAEPDETLFRTETESGVVLDHGTFTTTSRRRS